MLIHATNENFDAEVTNFDGIAVVDFWAPWCGPCKMLAPVFEELAEDFAGRADVKFVKVNTEACFELAAQYRIRAIPCIKVFKGGEEIDGQIGFVPKEVLTDLVSKYLE